MIIAVSRYTRQRILENVPSAQTVVINHGINLEQWACPSARESYSRTIISVGALKERKGYHVALEAFTIARKSIPDLRYVIVGDQRDRGYFERLKSITGRLGIDGAVTFKQKLDENQLREEYRSAGIFLLPSVNIGDHFEGFGLVFLEAAAMGLPVIGTTGNGIADAVGPENGILVPQNDARATAEAIVEILSDPEKRRQMSKASIRWASEHNASDAITRYERLYSEFI